MSIAFILSTIVLIIWTFALIAAVFSIWKTHKRMPKSAIKKSYTIREIIELTEGQYGSGAFKSFFNH